MPSTASIPSSAPLILLPACTRQRDGMSRHWVGNEYVEAVRLMGCRPFVVPYALGDEIDDWLAMADGVLLTGSASNVDAAHYGQDNLDPTLPLDPQRDSWTLPLVPRALALGVPLLAICRGFQEVNVALGGSLLQAVHAQPGKADHREPKSTDLNTQYGPAHSVHTQPGGVLRRILGHPQDISVNSLHGQGVLTLAAQAQAEAFAPDGLIEAFSVPTSAAFNLCVQWHPEWLAASNPVSLAILDAFGSACRARRSGRQVASPD